MAVKTFSAGEVLTASDTNTYLANAGLVVISSATITSTTTIANAFSSTYDSYRLVINALGNNGGEVTAQLRIGSSTSVNSYNWALWGLLETGTSSTYSATNQSFMTMTYGVGSCSYDIYGPYLAQYTWFSGSQVMDAGGTIYYRNVGGRHTQGTSYDQLVLNLPASATVRYTLMGYRKA